MTDSIQPNVTQGSTILLSDYNNIQTKIATILGTGSGTNGYGQSLASSQLGANTVIDDAHWDNLRTDLLKARQHQTGANESANLTDIAAGQLVDDAVVTQYENFATTVVDNKYIAGLGQLSDSGVSTGSTGVWNGTRTAYVTFTFSSADQARYFFNAGGYLTFYGSAGQATSGKDLSWDQMTNGVRRYVSYNNFWSLTSNGYTRLASIGAAAGVYVENRYYIDVTCNVPNNTAGGATVITVRFIFEDNDTGDQTGTGPAVDENVSRASVSGFTTRPSGSNVDVAAPSVSAPNF